MESSKRCCCIIGDVFIDVQANNVTKLPRWNSDTQASSIEILPGGSAANTARQLHALIDPSQVAKPCVSEVKFISTIGNDYFGKLFKQICIKEELKFHLEEINGPTSVCMCLSGPSDRAFVSCYSSTDAFKVDQFYNQIPSNTVLFHIGGFFNLIGLHDKSFLKLCRNLKESGIRLSISTQYDAREKWTGENDVLQELFPLCDIVFVNEKELENLIPVLSGHKGITVIETKGSKGCCIHTNGVLNSMKSNQDSTVEVVNVPIEKGNIDVVDATGAGDAFIAGFLERWMEVTSDHTVEDLILCCKRGNYIAGLNVQKVGACSEPIRLQDTN